MKSSRQITLCNWIDRRGVDNIAEALQVGKATVRHWRRLHCLPKAEQMRAIKKLSRGAVSYDSIIEPFFKVKNGGTQR